MTRVRWGFLVVGVLLFINFILTLAAFGGNNLANYPKICNQTGVYNNQTGVSQTVYYPCSDEIP